MSSETESNNKSETEDSNTTWTQSQSSAASPSSSSSTSTTPPASSTTPSTSSSHKPSSSLSSSPPPQSMFWSTWISPSSSASAAASSALESKSRPPKRRPTFEEFRAQEPPQARLIRLRGLFDTLLDSDDDHALAGGRARDEWTKSAMRARYGAGGSMARGSLAPKGNQNQNNNEIGQENVQVSSNSSSNTGTESTSTSTSTSKRTPPPLPAPPLKQSYASELLSQCRACRQEVEEERERERKASLDGSNEEGWNWNDLVSWVPGVSSSSSTSSNESSDSDKKSKDSNSIETKSSSSSKIDNLKETLSSFTSSSSPKSSTSSSTSDDSSSSSSSSTSTLSSITSFLSSPFSSSSDSKTESYEHHTTDQEGEAGWTGSKVWGLSAVGNKQREKDRELDQRVLKGQKVEDDGGKRQRQIEWEGFLKYAEGKERELYKIFSELDKNVDMRLDASEIRTALDRAGIDVHPLGLQDFIASLASSVSIASSNSFISGDGNVERERVYITFPEFRDYLLLLPRKPSVNEIFRFYQVRKAFGLFGIGGIFAEFGAGWGKTERGATAVNFDGDVSLAGEEKKSSSSMNAAKKEAKKSESEEKSKLEESKKNSSPSSSTSGGGSLIGGKEGETSNGPTGTGTADPLKNSSSSAEICGSKEASDQPPSSHLREAEEEEEEEDNDMIHGEVAVKFLLAGGIAGAVSRTATAPFDRLKIYLITTARSTATSEAVSGSLKGKNTVDQTAKLASKGAGILKDALLTLYKEGGGLKAFWLGNGLNCVKIFPESAIKFLSYETSKRAFAKYVDEVQDSRDISGSSRFLSGGIGGITSQLAIYPIETLKTRLMSSTGSSPNSSTPALKGNALLLSTARDMWKNGGMRTYYRGLVAGLIGVFPYSAIDMSTFEGIKLFYIKYTGKEEPGVLALLAFGSVSGSVGATTVYPLNLVRTRLQAAGTPAHPVIYDGFADAVRKTYRQEGMVGFYRGLVPTLAKVVPAVSISYVVYEQGKRKLGVQ